MHKVRIWVSQGSGVPLLGFLFAFGNFCHELLPSRARFIEATASPPSEKFSEPSSSVDMMCLPWIGRSGGRDSEYVREARQTNRDKADAHTEQVLLSLFFSRLRLITEWIEIERNGNVYILFQRERCTDKHRKGINPPRRSQIKRWTDFAKQFLTLWKWTPWTLLCTDLIYICTQPDVYR